MSLTQTTLKTNRQLLDPNFQGYKLSLEPVFPVFKTNLESNINEVKLNEDLYSLQHVKCFTLHNHLHQDPWNPHVVYYITDDLFFYQVKSSTGQKCEEGTGRKVFEFPKDSNSAFRVQEERSLPTYNANIRFLTPHLAVLTNGLGNLVLVETGDRNSDDTWKMLFSSGEFASRRPFLLLDSSADTNNDSIKIDCLLLRIENQSSVSDVVEDNKGVFVSILDWITISSENGVDDWEVKRISRLLGNGSIDYAAVDAKHNSIWIASVKMFKFVYDSIVNITTDNESTEEKQNTIRQPVYAWKQGTEEISVWFQLNDGVKKNDVDVKIMSNNLSVGICGRTFLEGHLFCSIDVDGCTWTLDETHKLEITLLKLNKGLMWQELVKGDESGEEIMDAELVQHLHERLAHLTSDKLNPDPQVSKLGDFNLEQLEECDDFPEHSFSLVVYDRSSLTSTHEISLSSHNWLFEAAPLTDQAVTRLCVRHDVDGLLCQPNAEDCTLDHVATFNAFGYVSASKQERKFTSCSPDASFVVMCDAKRHVYIYFQPTPLHNELRNRKTGQKVNSVARQKLVTLENADILGMQISNNSIFVLTRNCLCEIKVESE